MAFSDVSCPECHSPENIFRKRHSGIRYATLRDHTGVTIGELRYYQLHCHTCEALFYLQERRFDDVAENELQKLIVQSEEFQKASLHKPGTIQIGTTASEYTLMIAAGADRSYSLNRFGQ